MRMLRTERLSTANRTSLEESQPSDPLGIEQTGISIRRLHKRFQIKYADEVKWHLRSKVALG